MSAVSSPFRLGVIGAGAFASRRHLPDAQARSDVVVTALCRRDPDKLARMASHFGVGVAFTDYEDLLDNVELDGVLVASPHGLHYEHGKAVLSRGLHLLVEKPLTVRPEHARELERLAADKGCVVAVALNPPYWRHSRHVRETIASGRIGELESIHIEWTGNTEAVFGREPLPSGLPGVVPPTLFRGDPALGGGGYMMDSGAHIVCEAIWDSGREIVAVQAMMDATPEDMRCRVVGRMDNGALVSLAGTGDSGYRAKRGRYSFYGSAGSVYVDCWPFVVRVVTETETACVSEEELPDPPTPIGDWLDAIRDSREPAGSVALGRQVTEVLAAIYRSAKRGGAVSVG